MDRAGSGDILEFFFRARGRIGRTEYFLGMLFICALSAAALAYFLDHPAVPPAVVLIIGLLSLPLTVAQFVLIVKRCHDLGLPGIFSVFILVPFFGLVWLLALFFVPGTLGANRYGPPPGFRSD